MGKAKQLCPDLVTIPYDFEGYKQVSQQLYDIVARYVCLRILVLAWFPSETYCWYLENHPHCCFNLYVRAIPFKKLLGGVSVLDFLDHPAAILENNSDYPAAISAKQVGPPTTIQFHPFGGTLEWPFLIFIIINPMKWGG